MPLHIKRQENVMMLAIQLARNNMVSSVQSCPSIQAIVDENNLNLKDIIISQTPFFPPWTSISNMIDTSLTSLPKNTTSSQIYVQEFKNILDQYSNFIKIYTDASKAESNVGIAIIYNDVEEITYKLSVECSIYTAEAIAILKALEYSLEKQNNNFVILSDSLSSIISIANTHKPNDISKKIQLAISAHHVKGNVVKLMWVPGHSSIKGNEKADMLAKKIALTTPNGIITNISAHDAKRTIKLISAKSWQNLWSTQRTKLNEIKQSTLHWPNNHPNRKIESSINRLRIGHTKLTHGYLMSREEPPICSSCGVKLTIKHIMTECNTYRDAREHNQLPEDIFESLGPNLPVSNIIAFLQQSGLLKLI
ncbi:uncharacterized protein LOC132939856 [Metopolophium dirhodum]|uniref:uncharacterized protein LOC132939856 n=1 Tax=Metopolophium dirhodum TaxID=44670 RepID=UPI00298FC182|nr:uncharacterized protein LOC132939856 [Metopolophium dirhodum]